MKKLLRSTALAAALLGSTFGLAWLGDVNVAEAYSYDLDGAYYAGATEYPEYLNGDENLLLAYTHHGEGFYVDMSSVYCIQQDGPIYYLAGNIYAYDVKRGYISNEPSEERYKYDVSKGYIYQSTKDIYTHEFVYGTAPFWTARSTDEATKAIMSLSKLMWKAYSGEEWTN